MLTRTNARWIVLLCACSALASGVQAKGSDAIPAKYQQIAVSHNIPRALLYAIALTESGMTIRRGLFRPWPWTLNVAGTPRRYPSKPLACQALLHYLKRGITLIDIGLMQVNWHYHKDKIGRQACRGFDPIFNLRTGATILKQEYRHRQRWPNAIGRYHSPGQKPGQRQRARRYAQKVLRQLKKVHAQSEVFNHG